MAHEHLRGDQQTKQAVVGTLCFIAVLFAGTVCSLALRGLTIEDQLSNLATYILGVLSGLLAKTGIDSMTQPPPPLPDEPPQGGEAA